jgi:RNA polymerase sigma-70 factor (ECF subfamily)
MNEMIMSDQKLVRSYLAGNQEAIATLIERHRRRVFDYINMMVKDHDLADDIFQETFIKALRFIGDGRYSDNGKFLSWVMRIAHNQVIDYFRQKKSEKQLSESDAGFDIIKITHLTDTSVEEKMIATQIDEDVRMLIELLPEEQKEVIYLRYFNNMKFKDIAELTDVSINTALGRMRYALLNLRKLISEKNIQLS